MKNQSNMKQSNKIQIEKISGLETLSPAEVVELSGGSFPGWMKKVYDITIGYVIEEVIDGALRGAAKPCTKPCP